VKFLGQTNPKLKTEGLSKMSTPIIAKRNAGETPHDFIQNETEDPGTIGRALVDATHGGLLLNPSDDALTVEHTRRSVLHETESSPVGKHMAESQRGLAILCEFRPEVPHPGFKMEARLFYGSEGASGSKPLGSRPYENQRVMAPWLRAGGIQITSMQIRYGAIGPIDANGSADFAT
jgi:hypothetical protein